MYRFAARLGFLSATGAALIATLPATAVAQDSWPAKPITMVVPFPPGGVADTVGRPVAQAMARELKQSVIVDNKPGANGNLGADLVAKGPADGYTVLLCDVGALAISPSVYPRLPLDPSKELRGVTMLAYSPHLLVVHPSLPVSNVKELVALSKQKDLNFAVSGTGGAPHLAGVALARAVGARWEYVPYKGGSQAIQDTVGGQTQVMMNGMLATWPHVQSGKLKLLAVSKRTRMPLIGEVPTIAEQGVPGFESGSWQGVLAPRGTPDGIVQKLNAELVRAIRSPDVRARLAGQGAEVVTMTPAEQDQFFAAERKRWAQVVAQANIRAE
jgi:tripartite-type tricarboxylate transporter receptor subunit TctC